MAANVFGTPITTETLKGMPCYANKKDITRLDRAHVALQMKNAENKDINVRHYVEELKEKYGNGESTLCVIYNATGDVLKFVMEYDFHGHIWEASPPMLIENGQWGGFLHVHPTAWPAGSSGAVVYHGKNNDEVEYGWMVSWSNPWAGYNRVLAMVDGMGSFKTANWDKIYETLTNATDSQDYESNGCRVMLSMGANTSPLFEAILTLKNADGPPECGPISPDA